jgi:enediyne biosynthesis protein E4
MTFAFSTFFFRRAVACLVFSLLLPAQVRSQFSDQTKAAGITFEYVAGGLEKRHIVETSGGGAAFFDYDNDGDLDLYAVNGATVDTYQSKSGPGNVLYRNNGKGNFADIAAPAGVDDSSWGMGCTVGDIDGDGYRDLYVTNYGPNVLYHNQGGSTFANIAVSAGVAAADYSASAAFFDYDNDGDLDLYVTTYLVYDIESPPDRICTYGGSQIYCGPQGLPGAGDVLYRNDGNKAFTDVTRATGISWANRYYGLGVLPADFDNDGDTDLFVANDATPNLIFQNNGNGTFSEIGLIAGVAYNTSGEEEAGMGVDAGDYDNDGDLDLYVTHFFRESNTFYRNNGLGRFDDITAQAGLENPTLAKLGWGTQFFDYDNDADLDLFVANGHVYPQVDLARMGTSYNQHNQLFRNDGADKLVDVSAAAGSGMAVKKVSRGASFGDYDNDGDIDVFVINLDDSATLLRNDLASSHNWLVVQLFGQNVAAAKIRLSAAGQSQWRTVNGASSYLSYNDTRAYFGLGVETAADLVVINWPDGTSQTVPAVPANKLLVVHQNGAHAVLELGANPYKQAH